ncbi:MAG: TonB-dependent receptor [Cyclobacteriaceae bacterium]
MKRRTLPGKKRVPGIYMLSIVMLLLCGLSAQAQQMTIEGTITSSEDGLTVPGVNIIIKGTTTGSVSDIEGKYTIKANSGDILHFSFIGMIDQDITVGSSNRIDVLLEPDAVSLEEIVVIGYGTQKKKEVSGAVVRVDSEEINEFLTSDLGMAIQGRIAGVNVTASSGEPGAASNIQIRGVTSIDGSNSPLFVVDGIPQDGDPRIPNNEIESIDVLKDAASASIYGTRGAAGVILITTKSGKAGAPKVRFDASYGFSKITSSIPLMNTSESLYYSDQRLKYVPSAGNSDILNNPSWLLNDTDLRDFVQNDGASTKNYSLNVSGGQNNFSYSATVGLYDQEGVMVNSFLKRYNSRITTSYSEGKTKIRTSLGFSHENNDRMGGGLLFWAISYEPYQPPVDFNTEVVEVVGGPSQTKADNLLRRLKNINNIKRDRFNGSLDISHEVLKGLTLRTNIGGSINNSLNEDFTPSYKVYDSQIEAFDEPDPTKSGIAMTTIRQVNWAWNAMVNYTKKFGGHKINAMTSFSINERTQENFTAEAQGIEDPNLSVLDNGIFAEFATNGFNYVIRDVGLIGRVQYDYKGRYLLSASVRRDASSKFGSANRWGTFPSVSVGWNISDENFWSPVSSIANSIKLRGSIGTTGNESFNPYRYSGIINQDFDYVFDGSNVSIGTAQSEFSNALVQWETSIQSNIGLDMGFFENKLTVTADYYNTQKKDMLFPLQLPPSAGVPFLGSYGFDESVTLNVGDMTNKGIELAAQYRLRAAGVNFNLGGTFSRNRNKITRIFGDTQGYFNTSGTSVIGDPNAVVSKTQIGYEAGAFFLFETDGIIDNAEELAAYQLIQSDAALGDLKYVDQFTIDSDGDGIPDVGDGRINSEDQVYMGSGLPDYELGFNLNAEYKGFDFSMQWYASVGNEVINGSAIFAYGEGRHKNLVNMWTPANPGSTVPLRIDNHKKHPNYAGTTDLWLEDGSFARLRLVSLGYTLPKSILEKIGIDRLRAYASAQNPITFTKYTGYDPEIGGNNIIQRGLDKGSYPVSTQYLFGLELNF